MFIMRDTDAGIEMMRNVLDEALEQCTEGKGQQRHGHGTKLLDQPWRSLALAHGAGFLTGQASKKLGEAAKMQAYGEFTPLQYERELLGAIVYTVFAIMHGRLQDGALADAPAAMPLFPGVPAQ